VAPEIYRFEVLERNTHSARLAAIRKKRAARARRQSRAAKSAARARR
jgi:hypothetical protein